MKKIDDLLNNSKFKEHMNTINCAEVDRKFCMHDLSHLLDVARICYIINLEEGLGYNKEVIYAMALLHDIGRNSAYEKEMSHHEAGVILAREILNDIGFWEDEIRTICDAISKHKDASDMYKDSLSYILYRADKLSRNCFDCNMYDECYWMEDIKNKSITY